MKNVTIEINLGTLLDTNQTLRAVIVGLDESDVIGRYNINRVRFMVEDLKVRETIEIWAGLGIEAEVVR